MNFIARSLLLAALALTSCHSTIVAPEGMTSQEARQIIDVYTRERAPFHGFVRGYRVSDVFAPVQVLYQDQLVAWFPLTAGDTYFQRGERTGETLTYSYEENGITVNWIYPLMRIVDIRYRDVGELYTSYTGLNAMSPFTAFIVGPTILWPFQGSDGASPVDAPVDMRWLLQPWSMKAKLMSFAPLWLLGVPLWLKTDEEEMAEALTYMRAQQVEGRDSAAR